MANFSPGQNRSTKGASKQRRDLINLEIEHLKELLPLPESVRQRLFQLQVMSLICIYIRKEQYLQHILHYMVINPPLPYPTQSPYFPHGIPNPKGLDPCKAMKGFILVVTRQGKLLYISENATEYLGHSVEEIMSQGDSLYDLVDPRDHSTVQVELMSGPPSISMQMRFPDERIFICRMNLSRTAKRQLQYQKFVLVQGRYLHHAEQYQALLTMAPPGILVHPVFASFCQPLITPENAETMSSGNTTTFSTLHHLDMTFLQVDEMALYHLGYKWCELNGTSWYRMIHPQNLQEASFKHRLLCDDKEASCILLMRLQTWSGTWIWLHTVLAVREGTLARESNVEQLILATYQMVSDVEAATLQANQWIYSLPHRYNDQNVSVLANRNTDVLSDACSQADFVSTVEEETPIVTSGKCKRRYSRSSSTGSTKHDPSMGHPIHRGSVGSIQLSKPIIPMASRTMTPIPIQNHPEPIPSILAQNINGSFPPCALINNAPGPGDQIRVEIPSILAASMTALLPSSSSQEQAPVGMTNLQMALLPHLSVIPSMLTPDNSPADSSGSSVASRASVSRQNNISRLTAASKSNECPPLSGPHLCKVYVKCEEVDPGFDSPDSDALTQSANAHLPEIEPDSLEAYLRHVETQQPILQHFVCGGDPLLSATIDLSSFNGGKRKSTSNALFKDLDSNPHDNFKGSRTKDTNDIVNTVNTVGQSCALEGVRLARRKSSWQAL